ncbi:MAG: hypothetical protein OEU32_03060 [Acidimicrobiia bacterium]|nr:hypothetical protein [Acidimicrobiia bacterium]
MSPDPITRPPTEVPAPRRTRLAVLAMAGLLTGGLALGAVSPAGALQDDVAPPESDRAEVDAVQDFDIDTVRARCLAAIDRRLDDLATASARLAGVDVLPADHLGSLESIIGATESGLTELAPAIESAADATELRTECGKIAPDYRVYLVVLPQAHLTVGDARVEAAVERGTDAIGQLDEAIAEAIQAGADTAEAQQLRDQAAAQLDAADTAGDGVAEAVLAVTPASWNDGPGAETLAAAREDLQLARSSLHDARESLRAAVEALRDALGSVG